MKKKFFLSLLFIICYLLSANAQQASIQEITGSVELKKAGAAAWEAAQKGQTIAANTIVSTGFKSYALIKLGNSTLTVRPLTRLTLTEISATAGTETINVGLQAGRLRADLKPPSGANGAYHVQTPPATASVRGTVFEIDTFRLWVIEGAVEYAPKSGAPMWIHAGRHSYVSERSGRAALPEETMYEALRPDLPIAANFIGSSDRASQRANSMEVSASADF
jgi:hypothetical protein